MIDEANPTLARRVLAEYFRSLREQRGRSLDDVATALRVDVSLASRLDTGARGFKSDYIDRLVDWYGLAPEESRRLSALAAESHKRSWWQQEKLPDSFRTLIGLERGAEAIAEYCQTVVPGLMQTRAYAEAAVRAGAPSLSDQRVERAVDTRIRRQDILDRRDPPELSVILDEASLARTAGSANVMRSQLERLLELSKRPQIRIQVLPFSAGLYPAGLAQFIILSMPKSVSDVVYDETLISTRDTADPVRVRAARRMWTDLTGIALGVADSVDLVTRYRDALIDDSSPLSPL